MNRRWADVKDIGFREIAANQQDDIKKGQQAIEEMKRSGLLPPEVEDKAIQDYLDSVAQRIAQKSDLKVPSTSQFCSRAKSMLSLSRAATSSFNEASSRPLMTKPSSR